MSDMLDKVKGKYCNTISDLTYETMYGSGCAGAELVTLPADGTPIGLALIPETAKGAIFILEPAPGADPSAILARMRICGAAPTAAQGFPLFQYAQFEIGHPDSLAALLLASADGLQHKLRVVYANNSFKMLSAGMSKPGDEGLTNAELRAAPVTVNTGLVQSLTDAQLRAAPVNVSTGLAQPVTDAQLRASSVQIKLEGNTANIPALSIQPHISIGISNHHRRNSTADTNLTSVKAGPGVIAGIEICNDSAGKVYFKLYNKAAAPIIAADAALLQKVYMIPAGATLIVPITTIGYKMSAGIAYAITGALADTDVSAVQPGVIVNLSYT